MILLDETADMFGSIPLTRILVPILTLAYIFSYGWLAISLIRAWRDKRGVP